MPGQYGNLGGYRPPRGPGQGVLDFGSQWRRAYIDNNIPLGRPRGDVYIGHTSGDLTRWRRPNPLHPRTYEAAWGNPYIRYSDNGFYLAR
jgi:hypothetical protein